MKILPTKQYHSLVFAHVEQLRVPIALASSQYGLVAIFYERRQLVP